MKKDQTAEGLLASILVGLIMGGALYYAVAGPAIAEEGYCRKLAAINQWSNEQSRALISQAEMATVSSESLNIGQQSVNNLKLSESRLAAALEEERRALALVGLFRVILFAIFVLFTVYALVRLARRRRTRAGDTPAATA